jgi:hypothetical protein
MLRKIRTSFKEFNMSIFEVIMLVCFGISWPISIAKAIRTKVVSGKSPVFLIIIIIGYVSGIVHKMIYSGDRVIFLYVINLIMVAIDLMLYIHYKKLELVPEMK